MFKSGIRNRLMLSFFILIILTLSSLGSYILWFFHNYNVDRLSANLQAEAEITEQFLRPYMIDPREKRNIDAILKELAPKVALRLTVIDTNGTVLADSWENPPLMENHLNRPEIISALAGEVGRAARFSTTLGENLLYLAIPMRYGQEITGVLRVSTTLVHVEAGYNEIRNVLLLALLLTSILSIMLSIRLARRYTAPIEKITGLARQMTEGHLDKRIHLQTGDELEILGHTLNNLASRLDDKVNEIIAEKQKLELVFEHMDNAVVLFDRYGQVASANKKAFTLFSITPSMFGQHHIQVIGTSLLDKPLKESLRQGVPQRLDLKLTLHGVKRVFQVFLAPIQRIDQESPGVLTVFHDITALKELEERQADFVANASHELKTPLTTIKGFSETLLDGALSKSDLAAKFVTIIYEEAERMHRLVNDLLQLARIKSTDFKQHVKIEMVDVRAASETVCRQLTSKLANKSITATVTVIPEGMSICTSPDWLHQILTNLIENSIKFTPSGGKISITCKHDNNHAVITVKDSGVGIPPQDIPFIFDRFYRIDRARSRADGGTGLGLAIVKFMVETLGGHVTVHSKVDVGSTFTVTLPLNH